MGKKKAAVNGDFSCVNVGCTATGTAQINKQGPGCVRGCRRACRQRGDNRNKEVKGHCTEARTPEAAAAVLALPAAAAAAVGPLAEGDDGDPTNPCPICLVNEDDHGRYGQCFECGQLYCGACNGASPIETCPTCRAPIDAPAEVLAKRLLRLVARQPGRHTPVAQANLGVMYANGSGVVQDDAEAARWHRLAADQGLAMAQCNLGLMYTHGIGVAQEHPEAVRWYRLAADQGLAMAQCNLGSAYMNGDGVTQDDAEAARWYHLAAEQGVQLAKALLGQLAAGAPGRAGRRA